VGARGIIIASAYAKELCMHMHAYADFPDRKGKGLLFCTSVARTGIRRMTLEKYKYE